ncbi:hypothetical protein LTR62_002688 [Meristemomyces frigidus]|uniref:Uncharacterized protein n=1 Tax=Meristemomyces frigidus TaxID=1508187 RepID=A0AAN7YQ12_9PEZI|nr:hypothetical protein LTR62_002688 [Meristemomyces frigidus]
MSGGGNNITISYPGPEWQMLWPDSFGNFQLDIVGFLAVLGEGAVAANAQVSALSQLFYLPRLIPAPQALLLPTRPTRLEPVTKASVTAVASGNVIDHIHNVASTLLSKAQDMPPHMVRCVEIVRTEKFRTKSSWSDRALRGTPSSKARANTTTTVAVEPLVKAEAFGPLAWVTLGGFGLSVTLFMLSVVYGDGMSMLATLVLSLLSTLVGISNKWSLKLIKRRDGFVPAGDVVIRYPNGSFLVVKCDEAIARELFFAPEEIDYMVKSPAVHQLISLTGTLMLMFGVIALANARLELQFAWAGAYIIINAAYWIVAAVPPRTHWDFSCYLLTEHFVGEGSQEIGFTEALWKAIVFAGSIQWCRLGQPAAPQTPAWTEWLVQAQGHLQLGDPVSDFFDGAYWERRPTSEKGQPVSTVSKLQGNWESKKVWEAIELQHRTKGEAKLTVPAQQPRI